MDVPRRRRPPPRPSPCKGEGERRGTGGSRRRSFPPANSYSSPLTGGRSGGGSGWTYPAVGDPHPDPPPAREREKEEGREGAVDAPPPCPSTLPPPCPIHTPPPWQGGGREGGPDAHPAAGDPHPDPLPAREREKEEGREGAIHTPSPLTIHTPPPWQGGGREGGPDGRAPPPATPTPTLPLQGRGRKKRDGREPSTLLPPAHPHSLPPAQSILLPPGRGEVGRGVRMDVPRRRRPPPRPSPCKGEGERRGTGRGRRRSFPPAHPHSSPLTGGRSGGGSGWTYPATPVTPTPTLPLPGRGRKKRDGREPSTPLPPDHPPALRIGRLRCYNPRLRSAPARGAARLSDVQLDPLPNPE